MFPCHRDRRRNLLNFWTESLCIRVSFQGAESTVMSCNSGKCLLLLLAFLAIGLSRFADTAETKETQKVKDASIEKSEPDEPKEDSREKRSEEEIMFGNQQNKAIALVDGMLDMGDVEKSAEDDDVKNDTQKKDTEDSKSSEETRNSGEENAEDKRNVNEEQSNGMADVGSDGSEISSRWYSSAPVSSEALQYLLNNPSLQAMGPGESFVDINNMYDQRDMYRRKRQLGNRPFRVMKRTLRSPIGQMIHSRSPRLPRRSMRLKRQVNVKELLSMLRNADSNNAGNSYYKPVSGRINDFGYQEAPGYGYPYDLTAGDANNEQDAEDNVESKGDYPDSLLYRPPPQYMDLPAYTSTPYGTKMEPEGEQVPQWMARSIPQPSIFTVSRRSTPLFYPIDYRYVPGYKKRSSIGENDDQEGNFGKWGRVVQVPEAYASAEDVARLYALANLLAESENPEGRARRSD